MPLQVDNDLNNDNVGAVQILDGRFIMSSDTPISKNDVFSTIEYYKNNFLKNFQQARDYYNGKHPILNAPKKNDYKPDNRIMINFPKKAVNDFNGFFISNPVAISMSDNENDSDTINNLIQKWSNSVNLEKINLQVSKLASIYGFAFYYVYQDENEQTQLTYASPENTFIIYDDTQAQNPLYAVQFTNSSNDDMTVSLISAKTQWTLTQNDDSNSNVSLVQDGNAFANPFGVLPIIELDENDEKTAMCADLYTVFDAIDKAMSEKANDVDYFADAYLKLVNVSIHGDNKKQKRKHLEHIKRDRTIVANQKPGMTSAPDIGFVAKPDADTTQENLINRLVNTVYEIAGITNLNDQAFAGNPSGVSLQIKFSAMKNMATSKSIYMQSSLRQVFECFFAVQEGINNDAWQSLNFKFTQSLPRNLAEIGNFINTAYGKISQRLLLSITGLTNDIDGEIQEENEEKKQNMNLTSNMVQNQANNGGD